jgi:hypothetical protein
MPGSIQEAVCRTMMFGVLLGFAVGVLHAASYSKLTGRVVDPANRPAPGVQIVVRNIATLAERVVTTDSHGFYEVPALPAGIYSIQVRAQGFRPYTLEAVTIEVARVLVQNIRLELGDASQEITVHASSSFIDAATTSVGHVIDARSVQEIPLNGRHFLDLALLVPGSVTPSNGFGTTPVRGLGTFAINTAGNREETVNYMVNGITLNDLIFSEILYQPSISAIQEFKIDNSTFSAEYGGSSGAIVNVATRSGGNAYHGELFDFLRNNKLDARNFFTFTSSAPPPFKRNQFGANLGGPIARGRTFFFGSYEALRQSQKVDLNSLVLSDAERASVTNSVVARLVELIPRANLIDSSGTPRFVGSATAPVTNDQWGLDVSHMIGPNDRLHGYYSYNLTETIEPALRGNTIPGFGYIQLPRRQLFSLNETHVFGPDRINEVRFGVNRISSTTRPRAAYNPADFGIRNGVNQPIGLPQIAVAGGALNFGGPSVFPSGRGDVTFVAGDTFSYLRGRHSLRIGGEYRQFLNNNFRLGTGMFNFVSVDAFIADNANSFSQTLGSQSSSLAQGAFGLFVQDNFKWRPNLTFELGLRYDWNLTPDERFGRFIVFDPSSSSLERLDQAGERIYRQNNRNVQPRVGFAWDPFGDGKTAVRAAYAVQVDQPMTNVVTAAAANPPIAIPLAVTGSIRFENAIDLARAAGLAPATVDRRFGNAVMQSWNFNVQRQLVSGFGAMAGYFGSKGSRLILRRNINQPIDGVRPYPAVSQSSAILPGTPLGNITQAEGAGNSNYSALWVSASKPLTRGLQVNVSYVWSKSLDYNSQSTQGVVVQNSYNLRADRALSDFDTRHRLAVSALYTLPFRGHRLIDSWQLGVVFQAQCGNPVNIVTGNSTVTGVANTLRPDVTGPIAILGSVDRWFDTSAFQAVPRFGSLGRNPIAGPGFHNADVSIVKVTAIGDRIRLHFRVELFDVFNHANFAQPGNVVGTPGFGRITSTRFPTGESGSSRQAQLGVKVTF